MATRAGARAEAATERLWKAARRGDCARIEAALAAGADMGAQCSDYGLTALHEAVEQGHVGAVELLLRRGEGSPGHADGVYRSLSFVPWHDADEWPASVAVTRLLLDAGADVLDDARRPPLHRAAAAGCAAGVRMLLGAGADALAYDGEDYSPIEHAAGCCNAGGDPVGCIVALLDAGAVVAADDEGSSSPFRFCVPSPHAPALIRLLVSAGADVNAQDADDNAPLHYAAAFMLGTSSDTVRHDARIAAHELLACGAEATPQFWSDERVTGSSRAHRALLLGEAAWARRGHLVRLRKRLRQAADAAQEEAANAALVALPALQAELAAARAENAQLISRLAAAEARIAHPGSSGAAGGGSGCAAGGASGAGV
jgi:hypothetical protein